MYISFWQDLCDHDLISYFMVNVKFFHGFVCQQIQTANYVWCMEQLLGVNVCLEGSSDLDIILIAD